MTDEERAAIRERAAKAFSGPWTYEDFPGNVYTVSTDYHGDYPLVAADCRDDETGQFIAHAREDIPALLADVERLRAENAAWREIGQLLTRKADTLMDDGHCPLCGAAEHVGHNADCPVSKARVLLAGEETP